MEQYFTLKNSQGLEVVLSDLGASIYYIKYQDEYMTLSIKNKSDFINKHIYHGKTIGPIANRIPNGILKFGDKEFHYQKNERGNCLHSGDEGIENLIFSSEVEGNKVTFTLNKEGVHYRIIYELNEEGLSLIHEVQVDEDTPISLTNHAYFCLGDENINHLYLLIPADKFVEADSKNLLAIKERDVPPFMDFSKLKRIVEDIDNPYLINHVAKGYDHCFLLNKEEIILKNDRFQMNIKTDYPALHFYSGNYSDNVEFFTGPGERRKGIALEPEDNILKRELLHAGETYKRIIEYRFKKI